MVNHRLISPRRPPFFNLILSPSTPWFRAFFFYPFCLNARISLHGLLFPRFPQSLHRPWTLDSKSGLSWSCFYSQQENAMRISRTWETSSRYVVQHCKDSGFDWIHNDVDSVYEGESTGEWSLTDDVSIENEEGQCKQDL